MNETANPFLVYGYINPDYFCDRETETEKLISSLKNGRMVTLMSPRRMGKTGLIKNVFYHIKRNNPAAECFYLDIYSTNCLRDFVQVLARTILGEMDSFTQKAINFLKSCRLVFSADPISGSPQASLDFQASQTEVTLREIFDYLEQSGKECFVAIDEFQQITEYPEKGTEALLRSYIQFLPHVHFIFSGSKQHMMDSIFSSPRRPFYRVTERMTLSPIPENSYYLFASGWMKKGNKEIPKELFGDIYQRFEGHTWFMQYVLNKLYEQSNETITKENVARCIKEIVMMDIDTYQQQYNMLTENQRALLKAIAKEGTVTSINASAFINRYQLKGTSSVSTALKNLTDNEFVYHSLKGYQVYDRFMALWLQTLP